MKLICTMAARNEDWILGLSARAALLWCDHLVILDHASTDNQEAIERAVADEYPGRVTIVFRPDPNWDEMEHRQRMLEVAREKGATHIVYVDADEVLTGNLLPRIRDLVECTGPCAVLQLPWLSMRGSIHRYEQSGPWAKCDVSVAFPDDPRYHWAARQGYHWHQRHPMGLPFVSFKPLRRSEGGLMHLQFVSDRRLRAKQALYKMLEVTRWPGRKPVAEIDALYSVAVYGAPKIDPGNAPGLVQHFGVARAAAIIRAAREANQQSDEPQEQKLGFAPKEWWAPYEPWLEHLHIDAIPWQEAQCQMLWQQHGPAKFQGLDLFGVCG